MCEADAKCQKLMGDNQSMFADLKQLAGLELKTKNDLIESQ